MDHASRCVFWPMASYIRLGDRRYFGDYFYWGRSPCALPGHTSDVRTLFIYWPLCRALLDKVCACVGRPLPPEATAPSQNQFMLPGIAQRLFRKGPLDIKANIIFALAVILPAQEIPRCVKLSRQVLINFIAHCGLVYGARIS